MITYEAVTGNCAYALHIPGAQLYLQEIAAPMTKSPSDDSEVSNQIFNSLLLVPVTIVDGTRSP